MSKDDIFQCPIGNIDQPSLSDIETISLNRLKMKFSDIILKNIYSISQLDNISISYSSHGSNIFSDIKRTPTNRLANDPAGTMIQYWDLILTSHDMFIIIS